MRTSQTKLNQIITRKDVPTIVCFGTQWSGNAEMLFNILGDMENEFGNNADFCLVDMEENADFANHWGVREIPTTLIISNDEVVDFFTGLMSRGRIRQKINAHL